MTRHRTANLRNVVRRLRPSPARIAAAAAAFDPSLLLQLQATQPARPLVAPRRRGRQRRVAGSWHRRAPTQETAGALLLVAAVALALLWSNSPWRGTYNEFWHAPVGIRLGPWTVDADLRTLINEGLMTLFFLFVGLEAKRERDLGTLREGRRMAGQALAGVVAMIASAAVYLAVTAGGPGAGGWGVALSTDTALALGALTIAAGRHAARLRAYLLTILVVDDLVALLVISFVYPGRIKPAALIVAAALLTVLLSTRAVAARQFRTRGDSTAMLTPLSVLTGVALWFSLFESGIDPVVTGLIIGLLTNAYDRKAHRRASVAAVISPNERIQRRLRPWTTILIAPIFALANAGLQINGHLLSAAATSPVTWGIVLAFLIGKPLGIMVATRTVGRRALSDLSPAELRSIAFTTATAFTLSLLIASRAFDGMLLDQAKAGILVTAVLSPVLAALALAPSRFRHRSDLEGGLAGAGVAAPCAAS